MGTTVQTVRQIRHASCYHYRRSKESPKRHGSGFKTGCLSPRGKADEEQDKQLYGQVQKNERDLPALITD